MNGSGYAVAGSGCQGWPVRARVMASRTVRPWLRVVVRKELMRHQRLRLLWVCRQPETAWWQQIDGRPESNRCAVLLGQDRAGQLRRGTMCGNP